ncbi:hypothetical protein N9H93_04900 [Rhizobiaceae bacterium]|nr:hypothetical protein [Rhizobiaceae bacterium]
MTLESVDTGHHNISVVPNSVRQDPFQGRRSKSLAFNERILQYMSTIECRPVIAQEDLEDLFRFRYECYRADETIASDPRRRFEDHMDSSSNCMPFAMYRDGKLVSSLRLHHLTNEMRVGPSLISHGDVVGDMLDKDMTLLDPSRFTIAADTNEERLFLLYLTVRMAALAAVHLDIDRLLSLIKPAHAGFYVKVFGSTQLGTVRTYPGISFATCLLQTDYREAREGVLERYPFFDSLERERNGLFGPAPKARQAYDRQLPATLARPLTVMPSARFALAA